MIMTETTEQKNKLDFTEAGQKEYDGYPPQWKHIINRVVDSKEDGHDIIIDVINRSQSEDQDVREGCYGYLNDFFTHYTYKVDNEWRQQQFINLYNDIKKRQRDKLTKSKTNYSYDRTKRSNNKSERSIKETSAKTKRVGEK